jgi:Protein of unknown function (DUF3108)
MAHFLLIEKYHVLSSFSLEPAPKMLEARLVLNELKPAKIEPKNTSAEEVKPKPEEAPKQVAPEKEPKPAEKIAEPEPEPERDIDPLKTPEPTEPTQQDPLPENQPPQSAEPEQLPDQEEVKPQPYNAVETTFDVLMNDDKSSVGSATIRYQVPEQGKYLLTWEVKATGLLGLIYPNLVQTSQGLITEFGLQPKQYKYQFGNKADKTYEAEFNWSDKVLTLKTPKGDKEVEIADNAQDLLSFMYQFMFVPPLSNMQMNLTNGKKLAIYDYVFEGEEVLPLKLGEIKTYHIKHTKADSEDKTELWLAIDYQYLPVKIRKTEKDGTVIEQVATSIKTSQTPTETTP